MGNRRRLERLYSQQYQRQQQIMQTGSQLKKAGALDDNDEAFKNQTKAKPDSQLSHSSPLQVNKDGSIPITEEKELGTDFKNLNSDAYKNYHQAEIDGKKWLIGKEDDLKAKGFAIGPSGQSYKISNKDAVYTTISDSKKGQELLNAEKARQEQDPMSMIPDLKKMGLTDEAIKTIKERALVQLRAELAKNPEQAVARALRFAEKNPQDQDSADYGKFLLDIYNKPLNKQDADLLKYNVDRLLQASDAKLEKYPHLKIAKEYWLERTKYDRPLDQLDRYVGSSFMYTGQGRRSGVIRSSLPSKINVPPPPGY